MTNLGQLEELDNLTQDERKLALEILQQFSHKGNSQIYDNLRYEDFEEIPVDIETFLHDDNYLGNGLIEKETGRFTIFPFWEQKLKEIFPNNLDTTINTLIFTGPIGIGKTIIAVICLLYLLHRMLCLKDPYLHYGLQPIDKITFSMMNCTLDAAKGVAWDKMQQLLQTSP